MSAGVKKRYDAAIITLLMLIDFAINGHKQIHII